jgi:diguanylate cyclase (GGDEF)-like protein
VASDDFDSLRAEANAHFNHLDRFAEKPGRAQIGDDEARRARDLEMRIARAAGALLELGRNPLVGDEDHKDLRLSVRRMSAALRLRGYQQWDTRVVFDEDVYRGTEPGGQSEYDLGSVARARDEFNAAAEQFERVAIVAGTVGAPADHDDLLPLLRRKSFDQDLSKFLVDAESAATPVALLMIDVDHFKRVNDDHGHQVGDEALKSVASAVKHVVSGKGRAYRYGGEEMAVLAINLDAAEAVALGERIRKEIGREKRTSKALEITVSVGVAVYPIHASDARTLVARADGALYRAKNDGRNLTRVGDEEGSLAPIIEVRVAPKEASETAHVVSPEQPSSAPFKIPKMNDPELEMVSEHYRRFGREPVLPRMESRDMNLARGYELALYPGTTREVWVGFNGGAYEHLLMLKPSPKL